MRCLAKAVVRRVLWRGGVVTEISEVNFCHVTPGPKLAIYAKTAGLSPTYSPLFSSFDQQLSSIATSTYEHKSAGMPVLEGDVSFT
jgi:hypothetical protein